MTSVDFSLQCRWARWFIKKERASQQESYAGGRFRVEVGFRFPSILSASWLTAQYSGLSDPELRQARPPNHPNARAARRYTPWRGRGKRLQHRTGAPDAHFPLLWPLSLTCSVSREGTEAKWLRPPGRRPGPKHHNFLDSLFISQAARLSHWSQGSRMGFVGEYLVYR